MYIRNDNNSPKTTYLHGQKHIVIAVGDNLRKLPDSSCCYTVPFINPIDLLLKHIETIKND